MKPIVVIPMHDPAGIFFPHLRRILPLLKEVFGRLFVSVTAVTQQSQPDALPWLQSDPFFRVTAHKNDIPVGEDFMTLYANAAAACEPEQVLHLCFIDRVAFALQSEYKEVFVRDVTAVIPSATPLIFERSPKAWNTHPKNYHDFEQMVRQTGEWLLGKSLDFGWCHLAIQARQLSKIIGQIKARDLSIVAEIALSLRDDVQSKEVDWLAWEDPFILSRDAKQLKKEREQSLAETQKRLATTISMLQLLKKLSVVNDQLPIANCQ